MNKEIADEFKRIHVVLGNILLNIEKIHISIAESEARSEARADEKLEELARMFNFHVIDKDKKLNILDKRVDQIEEELNLKTV